MTSDEIVGVAVVVTAAAFIGAILLDRFLYNRSGRADARRRNHGPRA